MAPVCVNVLKTEKLCADVLTLFSPLIVNPLSIKLAYDFSKFSMLNIRKAESEKMYSFDTAAFKMSKILDV